MQKVNKHDARYIKRASDFWKEVGFKKLFSFFPLSVINS
jgi:hypothetical protein